MIAARALSVLALWGVLSGCVAMRNTGELPRYPSDRSLQNDGSRREQQKLLAKYEIIDEGLDVRIGDANRVRGGRLPPSAGNLHPEMLTYLGHDPEAREILPSDGMRLALIVVRVVAILSSFGLVTFFLIGLPVMIVGIVMEFKMQASEADAIVAYNRGLRRRISAGVVTREPGEGTPVVERSPERGATTRAVPSPEHPSPAGEPSAAEPAIAGRPDTPVLDEKAASTSPAVRQDGGTAIPVNVLILPVAARGGPARDVAKKAASALAAELSSDRNLKVSVLAEHGQRFPEEMMAAAAKCSEPECGAKLGRAFQVDEVVVANIAGPAGQHALRAARVRSSDGTVLQEATERIAAADVKDGLSGTAQGLARQLYPRAPVAAAPAEPASPVSPQPPATLVAPASSEPPPVAQPDGLRPAASDDDDEDDDSARRSSRYRRAQTGKTSSSMFTPGRMVAAVLAAGAGVLMVPCVLNGCGSTLIFCYDAGSGGYPGAHPGIPRWVGCGANTLACTGFLCFSASMLSLASAVGVGAASQASSRKATSVEVDE